jgi:hypothetical protein
MLASAHITGAFLTYVEDKDKTATYICSYAIPARDMAL